MTNSRSTNEENFVIQNLNIRDLFVNSNFVIRNFEGGFEF